MSRFYSDENFRRPVVEELRRRGHDVLTCQDAGRAGQQIPDEGVLADALALGRIVLTQDRDDFRHLHERGVPHGGIVTCSYEPDTEGLASRIEETVLDRPEGGRWLSRVIRPNPGDPARR